MIVFTVGEHNQLLGLVRLFQKANICKDEFRLMVSIDSKLSFSSINVYDRLVISRFFAEGLWGITRIEQFTSLIRTGWAEHTVSNGDLKISITIGFTIGKGISY